MAAIGIILILKQYPVLLGQSSIAPYHLSVFLLGIGSLVLLFVWDMYFSQRLKQVPGSLIVVLMGIFATLTLNSFIPGGFDTQYFVQIPAINSFAQFKEIMVMPDWSAFSNPLLYKTAIVLALVASIESLLCINGIERLDPLKRPTNKNRELVAQGIGNTFSGLIGGLPITSVIVRSSVNLNAGAKSKASAISHGVLIVLVLLFGTKLINHVPLVSLAAVLIFTGHKLAHPKHFITAWKTGKVDFIAFFTTAAVVVVIDLLVGVMTGLAVYYILKHFQKIRPAESHA
jgi:MFS superfamily sulfate permease-like transporter